MITPRHIKENKQIQTYIRRADETLAAMGYTEHSTAHVARVAHFAEKILAHLAIPSAPASWPGSPVTCTTSAT